MTKKTDTAKPEKLKWRDKTITMWWGTDALTYREGLIVILPFVSAWFIAFSITGYLFEMIPLTDSQQGIALLGILPLCISLGFVCSVWLWRWKYREISRHRMPYVHTVYILSALIECEKWTKNKLREAAFKTAKETLRSKHPDAVSPAELRAFWRVIYEQLYMEDIADQFQADLEAWKASQN